VINLTRLNQFRYEGPEVKALWGDPLPPRSKAGVFYIPLLIVIPGAAMLKVLATTGEGWDHVSVSLPSRTPTWAEMDRIKRMFFRPDEVAMQLHVAVTDHINVHNYTLHLWRPTNQTIPLPPKEFV